MLDVLFAAQVLFYPEGQSNLLLEGAAAATIAVAAVVIWIRPKLILNHDHLIVVNPFRTIRIDYRQITGLDTKWVLTIHHDQTSTRVWVAPVNGKQRWITDTTHRWSINKMPRSDKFTGEVIPASMSLNSDSGLAADLIKRRLETLH